MKMNGLIIEEEHRHPDRIQHEEEEESSLRIELLLYGELHVEWQA